METMIPEYLKAKLDAPLHPRPSAADGTRLCTIAAPAKPIPPTRDMLAALKRTPVETTFPPLDSRGAPQEEPARFRAPITASPPAPAPRAELGAEAAPQTHAPLRYQFRRTYGEVYTNKDCKFVLREEHVADLLRLYHEFNKHRPEDAMPMTLSDIVGAALDFVLDHPVSFQGLKESSQARDAIASAVQRRAFTRFLPVYESL